VSHWCESIMSQKSGNKLVYDQKAQVTAEKRRLELQKVKDDEMRKLAVKEEQERKKREKWNKNNSNRIKGSTDKGNYNDTSKQSNNSDTKFNISSPQVNLRSQDKETDNSSEFSRSNLNSRNGQDLAKREEKERDTMTSSREFHNYVIKSWPQNGEEEKNKTRAAEEERKQNPPVDNDGPVTKTMTFEELAQHDGVKSPTVYIGVKNQVFDASNSESYKPGGGYAKFAGKECSVALAKMSMEDKHFNCFEGHKLSLAEVDSLEGWYTFMKKKYKIVANIAGSKKDD